jgi:transposase InsO family protein
VDGVTQWQIVGATAHNSEAWLMPVLEAMLRQFPFQILGFHSDNGSEFINHTVAIMLNKFLVEQTKSRPRHCNDNGLVETKNGAVIRKHMVLRRESVPVVPAHLHPPGSSCVIQDSCAACRINSSSASRSGFAAAARSSHCVAAGKGIPNWPCSLSSRLNGTQVAVFQQSDHSYGRLVVLRRTGRLRFVGSEKIPGVAAQSGGDGTRSKCAG